MSEIAKRNGPCYTLLHIVQALFELELINKTKTIVCWLLGQWEVNPNVSRHQDITLHYITLLLYFSFLRQKGVVYVYFLQHS